MRAATTPSNTPPRHDKSVQIETIVHPQRDPTIQSERATADAAPRSDALRLERPTVARYVLGVLAVGIPLLTVPVVMGLPVELFLLALVYVVLLGGAVLTAQRSGPGGVRKLFSGVLHWRIGVRNWAVVAAAIPTATVAVAFATGTYTAPSDGWPVTIGNYLFFTFIFGALVLNIVEEAAWQGLVQRHLTQHRGAVRAAMITAVPFAAIHLPLSFVGDVTMVEALGASALVFLFAPAMRYVMGHIDITTGGSLLAVGVMHASFNASGQLGVTDGGWQSIAGLAVVAVVAFLVDRRNHRAVRGTTEG